MGEDLEGASRTRRTGVDVHAESPGEAGAARIVREFLGVGREGPASNSGMFSEFFLRHRLPSGWLSLTARRSPRRMGPRRRGPRRPRMSSSKTLDPTYVRTHWHRALQPRAIGLLIESRSRRPKRGPEPRNSPAAPSREAPLMIHLRRRRMPAIPEAHNCRSRLKSSR